MARNGLSLAPVLLLLLLLLFAPAAEGAKDEKFYPDKVVLDPFPREAKLNGTITFRARLKSGYRAPVFVLTRPDGETSYLHPIRTEPGGVYEFDVGFKAGEGPYRVEVVVESKRGDTTAAQFTVRVGEKPAEEKDEGPRPESLYPSELDGESTIRLERKLFRLLNDYRAGNGRKPYPWLEKAAQLGRDHMTDYLALKPRPKRLTHRIPGKDTIADRFMDFFAWPTTIPKFPVRDPKIGPEARSYCAESLAAPRSLDWLFREVFIRESAFRAPVISEFPTHAAVGIVRDTGSGETRTEARGRPGAKPGRLYTAAVYVQVNSTRVRAELEQEHKETTKQESRAGADPARRAELLRRLGRMGDPRSGKLFMKRLGDRRPEVRAAALDALFLNAPERAHDWLSKQLPRLVRAHKDAKYGEEAKVLGVLARVQYDARTRNRGVMGLARLERLAETVFATALDLLDEGEVKEAHETMTLMLEQFAGLEGARKAAEKLREIKSDPKLKAKLEE